jgi:hypothetical protein
LTWLAIHTMHDVARVRSMDADAVSPANVEMPDAPRETNLSKQAWNGAGGQSKSRARP